MKNYTDKPKPTKKKRNFLPPPKPSFGKLKFYLEYLIKLPSHLLVPPEQVSINEIHENILRELIEAKKDIEELKEKINRIKRGGFSGNTGPG